MEPAGKHTVLQPDFFFFLGLRSFFQISKAKYTSLFLIANEILFTQFFTFGNEDSFNFLHFPYIYVFMCN